LQNLQRPEQVKRKEFAKGLLWFKYNNLDLPWRYELSSYKILITEKLLQQTDVGHVLNIYDDFFDKFPSVRSLADAEQEEIQKAIKTLGFWRIRARDLRFMAKQLIEKYSGEIPRDKQKLLELFGIGQYIASAV
jgi:A/G-specific adenine glycosylase